MKTKKLILSIIAVLGVSAFSAINAHATTWYVRDGGGTPTQCTGTTNAVYPGSGTDQPCAFNHPRYAIGWDNNNPQPGKMVGGDTVSIDGDSDINPGQQAQYLIGYDNTGANTTPTCSADYSCILANLPAGISASQPTSIIGTGTHKPQLWGNLTPWQVISANNNYITLQWLEITDHTACAYNDPAAECLNNFYPDGIVISGTGITLTDLYIHGNGRFGINAGQMGSATFTRVWVIGNGFGGITFGNNGTTTITGTLTFNQPIIEWNGCVEAYPMANPGIDNPSNYSNCFGQDSGGYGDGLAFGNATSGAVGNWNIYGPGSISFNTQDGLDTLHGGSTGNIQVDKMRFEGNAGQQVKINAINMALTNSVIIGDCGWWYNAPQSLPGGMQPGDSCRAVGDTVLFNVTNSSTINIYNNTIVSNGSIALESKDVSSTGCNSGTNINVYNNIVQAGYAWWDDSAFNSAGGNSQTAYIYNDGNDGNGSGSCGNLTWNEDYNIVTGAKNNNQGCAGSHDKCGISPAFAAGAFPVGTAGGAANTFYQGNAGESLVSLSSSSPAIAEGVTGLTYWNTGNDYHNVTRTDPPSIGGLEANSCAANAYGCFFNSDCCAGSCSNFVCETSSATPVVAITSPTSGSSSTAGTNFTVTTTASETNGAIRTISLYNGAGVLLGSSSASPYNYVMTSPAAGTYTFYAVATDTNGVSTTSSSVTVTVEEASVLPSLPVVAITSPAGSTFTAGSNVTLNATASETNGTISKISIYNGTGALLGSSSTSPYNYVYSDALAGTYTFYAVATDANGVSTTSSLITVTVTAPSSPVVAITSPVNGSSFVTGSNVTITATASETNGSIAKVSFYYNGTYLMGSSTTAPYSVTVNGVVAGNYTLTAVATDANGVSVTSSPVTAVVSATAKVSPVVTIIVPGSGTSFTAGSDIAITATASETGGTISKVMFYSGSTLLGTDTKSPYSYTWSSVAAGNYSLTAVAYDINNNQTTSTAVPVTVTGLPVVSLTTNNASFTAPASIVLTATASETNGTISKVMFYNGSTLLGTDTTSPYTYTWSSVAGGTYSLTAVATDANGVSTTSSAVSVTVAAAAKASPVVAITSPANGASFTSGSNVTIAATASETSGTISKVEFYNGSTLLGTDTKSPYSYTWSNVAAGNYSLTAVAYDSNNNQTTSTAVAVTVSGVPVVSLASNNTSFTAPASVVLTATASETNGTISKVAFYNGSTLLATDTTSPYSYTWSSVAAGSYSLTAVATDANGVSTTSSAVAVTVAAAAKVSPVVAITSPANGTSFTSGSNVTIAATASETNGTISKVEFYNGSTLLGTDTKSPYSYTWSNVAAGNYSLTAVAYDKNNNTTTSTAVAVTVSGVPVVSLASNNTSFTAPASVILTATASETNGTISKVAFYNGSTLLGTDTTSPYSYTWSNVAAGSYSLTAVATDANGISTTSSVVSVIVTAAVKASPVVAIIVPADGTVFTAGSNVTITAAASETNGSIAKVTFYYNGTNLIGSSTTSPYTVTVNNVVAGSYAITAIATDANGVSVTSSPVNMTAVAAPIVPVVAITSPASGSSVTAGSSITITATASETSGSISKVAFYNGTTLLGTDASSPYSYTWSGAAAGTYNITAVATDAKGVAVTSSAVTVTVNPTVIFRF